MLLLKYTMCIDVLVRYNSDAADSIVYPGNTEYNTNCIEHYVSVGIGKVIHTAIIMLMAKLYGTPQNGFRMTLAKYIESAAVSKYSK